MADFTFITKSKILSFAKCYRLFLYQITNKTSNFKKDSFTIQTQEILKIKDLARLYFHDGFEIKYHEDLYLSYHKTLEALRFEKTLYHPVLIHEDCVSSPEFLEYKPDGYFVLWEVAYSPHTNKDIDLIMGFHRMVAENLQLPIHEYKVLTINPNYLHKDKIVPKDYFREISITKKSKTYRILAEQIRDSIRKFKKNQFSTVDTNLPSCAHYKACFLPDICYPQRNKDSIFTLRESASLVMELYNKGITKIEDIPEDDVELTFRQRIQIQSEKSGKPYIDKKRIQNFLNQIQYPVYYLDFETINPLIPIYPNSRPNQHIPFLFSLHVSDSPNSSNLRHYDYIQPNEKDPRKAILEKLSEILGNEGSIICFNDFFEKNCIREALEYYPEFKYRFESIMDRFLDISVPFRNFDYYNPAQKGSGSLKNILPAMTGKSHNHLIVKDGHSANLTYLEIVKLNEFHKTESNKILEGLKEYCKMDTYALYLIQKKLEELVKD